MNIFIQKADMEELNKREVDAISMHKQKSFKDTKQKSCVEYQKI
jgi:hypothetical protein